MISGGHTPISVGEARQLAAEVTPRQAAESQRLLTLSKAQKEFEDFYARRSIEELREELESFVGFPETP